MIDKIALMYRTRGPVGVALAARRALWPSHPACLRQCRELVCGRSGLEIGGPSGVFRSRGVLPLYPCLASLDNCNFAGHTTWEGSIAEGRSYRFHASRPPGWQYLAETTDLSVVPSNRYDFLLSSHVIEHTANPLRALSEWMRVLKDGSPLVILVPHKDDTFDHRRPVTTLEHLVADQAAERGEDDLSHLPEILELHDLRRDPLAGSADQFRARSLDNARNRCLHHHVFDTGLVVRMLDHVGLQLLAVEPFKPGHVIALARKPHPGESIDNADWLSPDASFSRNSPFPSDRRPSHRIASPHSSS